jgi:hypothetical protein
VPDKEQRPENLYVSFEIFMKKALLYYTCFDCRPLFLLHENVRLFKRQSGH